MNHTPGPWRVAAGIVDNPRLIVEDDIGNPVCAMSLRGVYGDTVKMTANAALIAAAPEMLEALEAMVEMVEMNGLGKRYALDLAASAIRKARWRNEQ